MTHEILNWIASEVAPLKQSFGDVFEVGSYNVNGSPRSVLMGRSKSWVGCDRVAGPDVDEVGIASQVIKGRKFDTIIACECYEHDPRFWETNAACLSSLNPGGIYVITSPTIGFPFHDYGGDFYRFTEMALRSLFGELIPIDIRTVGTAPVQCVVGCAVKPLDGVPFHSQTKP